MSGPLRTKQGCWTCRLRKKKCDEGRPYCSTCQTLSITCYGFGRKPDWMDNGEEERAVIDSFKQIVKHTSRHKATNRPSKQRDPMIRIVPKSASASLGDSSSRIEPRAQLGLSPPSDHGISRGNGDSTLQDGSVVSKRVDLSLSLKDFNLN